MTTLFAASHALISKDGKFLVTKRAAGRNYMPGKWDIPGGTIEAGEDPVEALAREIEEEVSIKVKVGPCLYIFNNMVQFPNRQTLQIVYSARYVSGDVVLNDREHSEFNWIRPEEIRHLDKINFLDGLIDYLSELDVETSELITKMSRGWSK